MPPTLGVAAVMATLALSACAVPTSDPDERTGEAREAAIAANAIAANAIAANAIAANAIAANALSTGALSASGVVAEALESPEGRQLFGYVVSCALPAGESVTVAVEGESYTFAGELGLAPEWGRPHGHCNTACREWVSACVLSRVDYLEETMLISLRGSTPALRPTAEEVTTYTVREAGYFGDIFAAPQRLFACLAPGRTQIPRVCGPSTEDCVVSVVGRCDEVCGRARPDGSFPDCRAGGRPYHGSITVFLHP